MLTILNNFAKRLSLVRCSLWLLSVGGILGTMAWLVSRLPSSTEKVLPDFVETGYPLLRQISKTATLQKGNDTHTAIDTWCATPKSTIAESPAKVFAGFRNWYEEYAEAQPELKPELVDRGVQLASKRRAELKKLIHKKPRAALGQMVPVGVRKGLPRAVARELEEIVSGVGSLSVLHACFGPAEGYRQKLFRTVRMENGQKYDAYAYGRRALFQEKQGISIYGIAVDDDLALFDSPGHILRSSSVAVLGLPPSQTHMEMAGELYSFNTRAEAVTRLRRAGDIETESDVIVNYALNANTPNRYRYQLFDENLTWDAAEQKALSLGGQLALAAVDEDKQLLSLLQSSPLQSAWVGDNELEMLLLGGNVSQTQDPSEQRPFLVEFPLFTEAPQIDDDPLVRVLVIPARYKDQAPSDGSIANFSPITIQQLHKEMKAVVQFYSRESNGKMQIEYNATGTVTLPENLEVYDWLADEEGKDSAFGELMRDAVVAAKAANFSTDDYDDYDKYVVVTTNAHKGYGGLGGGKNAHCPSWSSSVIIHELGHCFGLPHANQWVAYGESPIGDEGFQIDYGNPMSVMGGSGHSPSPRDAAAGVTDTAILSKGTAALTLWAKSEITKKFYEKGSLGSSRGADIIKIDHNTTDQDILDSNYTLSDEAGGYKNYFRIYHHDYDLSTSYINSQSGPIKDHLEEKGLAPWGLKEGTFLIRLPEDSQLKPWFDGDYSLVFTEGNATTTSKYSLSIAGTGNDVNASIYPIEGRDLRLVISNGGSGFLVEPTLLLSKDNEPETQFTILRSWIRTFDDNESDATNRPTTLLDKRDWSDANYSIARGLRGIMAPASSSGPEANDAFDENGTEVPVDKMNNTYTISYRREFNHRGLTFTLFNLLLDMTRETPEYYMDGSLLIGRTYTDLGADLHVTPIRHGGTYPMEYIDVVVRHKTSPGNRPPTASLNSNKRQPNVGERVEFSVSIISDDDNDTKFAYTWYVNDTMLEKDRYLNRSAISYGFDRVGRHRIRVEVSDMKGGVDSITKVVDVGAPATFEDSMISGRVIGHTGEPVRGARVILQQARPILHNVAFRQSFDDSTMQRFYVDGEETPALSLTQGQWHRFIFDSSLLGNPLSFGKGPEHYPPVFQPKMTFYPWLGEKGEGYSSPPAITDDGLFDPYWQNRYVPGPEWTEEWQKPPVGNPAAELNVRILKKPKLEAILKPTTLSSVTLISGGSGYEEGKQPTVTFERTVSWSLYHPYTPADGNFIQRHGDVLAEVDGVGTIGFVVQDPVPLDDQNSTKGTNYPATPSISVLGRGEGAMATTAISKKLGRLKKIDMTDSGKGYDAGTTYAFPFYPTQPRTYLSFDKEVSFPGLSGWGRPKSGLFSHWKFEALEQDGKETVFLDATGNRRHLYPWKAETYASLYFTPSMVADNGASFRFTAHDGASADQNFTVNFNDTGTTNTTFTANPAVLPSAGTVSDLASNLRTLLGSLTGYTASGSGDSVVVTADAYATTTYDISDLTILSGGNVFGTRGVVLGRQESFDNTGLDNDDGAHGRSLKMDGEANDTRIFQYPYPYQTGGYPLSNSFAISFWIKNTGQGPYDILNKEGAIKINNTGVSIVATLQNDKTLTASVPTNKWVNVVLNLEADTLTGLDMNASLSIDGISVDTIADTFGVQELIVAMGDVATAEPLVIAQKPNTNAKDCGLLDEIRIYDRSLTPTEILEEAGLLLLDSSGNRNHGVLFSSELETAIPGNLDGKGTPTIFNEALMSDQSKKEYVDLFPAKDDLDSMTSGTVCMWFATNGRSASGGDQGGSTLFSASNANDAAGDSYLQLRVKNNGQLSYLVKNDGVSVVNFYTEDTYADQHDSLEYIDEWHHVALVVSDKSVNFFVDGRKAKKKGPQALQGAVAFLSDVDALDTMSLGRLSTLNPAGTKVTHKQYLHGYLDEFCVFDRNLTEEEIAFIYEEGEDRIKHGEDPVAHPRAYYRAELDPDVDAIGTLRMLDVGEGYRAAPKVIFSGGKAEVEATIAPTEVEGIAFSIADPADVNASGTPLVDANLSMDACGTLVRYMPGYRTLPKLIVDQSPSDWDEDAEAAGIYFVPDNKGADVLDRGVGLKSTWGTVDDFNASDFSVIGRGSKPPVFDVQMNPDPIHEGFLQIAAVRLRERGYGPYDNNESYLEDEEDDDGEIHWYLNEAFITGGDMENPPRSRYTNGPLHARLKVNIAGEDDVAHAEGEWMSIEVLKHEEYDKYLESGQPIKGGVGYKSVPVIDLSRLQPQFRLEVKQESGIELKKVPHEVQITDRGLGYRKPLQLRWHGGYGRGGTPSTIVYPVITYVTIDENNGSIMGIDADFTKYIESNGTTELYLSITGAGGMDALAEVYTTLGAIAMKSVGMGYRPPGSSLLAGGVPVPFDDANITYELGARIVYEITDVNGTPVDIDSNFSVSLGGTIASLIAVSQEKGGKYAGPRVVVEGNGVGAVLHALVRHGKIDRIIVEDPGKGYSWAEIKIEGGASFNVYGEPFTTEKGPAPGPVPTEANCTAALSFGKIVSVSVDYPGENYYQPEVVVTGTGSDVIAVPVLEDGILDRIFVASPGDGFTEKLIRGDVPKVYLFDFGSQSHSSWTGSSIWGKNTDFGNPQPLLEAKLADSFGGRIHAFDLIEEGWLDANFSHDDLNVSFKYEMGEPPSKPAVAKIFLTVVMDNASFEDPLDDANKTNTVSMPGMGARVDMLGTYGYAFSGLLKTALPPSSVDGNNTKTINPSYLEQATVPYKSDSNYSLLLEKEDDLLDFIAGNNMAYDPNSFRNYIDLFVRADTPSKLYYYRGDHNRSRTGGSIDIIGSVPGMDWYIISPWKIGVDYRAGDAVIYKEPNAAQGKAYLAKVDHLSGAFREELWEETTIDGSASSGQVFKFVHDTLVIDAEEDEAEDGYWAFLPGAYETYTDSEGYYAFTQLDHGLYNLAAVKEGKWLVDYGYNVAGAVGELTHTVMVEGMPKLLIDATNDKKGTSEVKWSQEALRLGSVDSSNTVLKGVGVGFSQKPLLIAVADSQNDSTGRTPLLNVELNPDGDGTLNLTLVNTQGFSPADKFRVKYITDKSGIDFWQEDWVDEKKTPDNSPVRLTLTPNSAANAVPVPLMVDMSQPAKVDFTAIVWDNSTDVLEPQSPIEWSWLSDFDLSGLTDENKSKIAAINVATDSRQADLQLYSTLRKGRLLGFDILSPGVNYELNASQLEFSGSNGKGAMAIISAVDENGGIVGLKVLDPGEGYFEDGLAVTITGGKGSTAVLQPIVGQGIITLTAQMGDLLAEVNATAADLSVLEGNETRRWMDRYFDTMLPEKISWGEDPDNDELNNTEELAKGTNPLWRDSDGDGLSDKAESNTGIYVDASTTGTNPRLADTDGDGLSDKVESNTGKYVDANNTGTDPFRFDTDGDGRSDGVEVSYGLNPLLSATSGEGANVSGMVYLPAGREGVLYVAMVPKEMDVSGGFEVSNLLHPFKIEKPARANLYLFKDLPKKDIFGTDITYNPVAFIDENETLNAAYDANELFGEYAGDWNGSLTSDKTGVNILITDPAPVLTLLPMVRKEHEEMDDGNKTVVLYTGDVAAHSKPLAWDAHEGEIKASDIRMEGNWSTVMEYEDVDVDDGLGQLTVRSSAQPGVYEVIYSATDQANSVGTVTRTFIIKDKEVPVIELNGTMSTHEAGTVWVAPIAYASDNVDGNLTQWIVRDKNVSQTTKPGETVSIVYSVSDTSGNEATLTLDVVIVDTSPPSLQLLAADHVYLEQGETYLPPAPIANDSFDGDLTSQITIAEEVNVEVPGDYPVVFSVTDTGGNEANVTQWVHVNSWALVLAGKAMDGYLVGASVVFDMDGDGTHDLSKPVLTDQNGAYSFAFTQDEFDKADANENDVIDPEEGRIRVSGGIDSSTLEPFTGLYEADANSTVVNPLTTLVTALIDQNMSREEAKGKVTEALGLSEGMDILSYDLIEAASEGDAASGAALAASARVANAIRQAGAFARYVSDGVADEKVVSTELMAEVAKKMASGETVPLGDASQMQLVLGEVVESIGFTLNLADTDLDGASRLIVSADELILESKAAYAQPDALASDLAKIQAVVEDGVVAGYEKLRIEGGTPSSLAESQSKAQLAGQKESFSSVNVFPPKGENGMAALSSDRWTKGALILSLEATDADGDIVSFSIIGGNPDADKDGDAAFSMSTTGVLTVEDSDEKDSFIQQPAELTIRLSDGKGLSGTSTVSVSLGNPLALGASEVAEDTNWKTVEWLGQFFSNDSSWIYHEILGWLFVSPDQEGGFWFWSANQEAWLWTSPKTYPYLHKNLHGWMYLRETGTPMLFDYLSGIWLDP